MTANSNDELCPDCGATVPPTASRCPSCGEWLEPADGADERDNADQDDDAPRRPRREETVQATDFLVPTNVSIWAMASCYLGLIGFCVPFFGLIFAIPAFACGLVAVLKKPPGRASYGSVTGNIRAVIGLVLSGLAILIWGGILVIWAISPKMFR